ncbi:MAG: zinc ribbon domain-containing protein [Oscillospiraceae bacterium]|nr:zinc ribbon domain-containing protein [Oscillospiraceae bacterium]
MEIYKNYELFRKKCDAFEESFKAACFKNTSVILSPLKEGEIISICTKEEARSNANHICRLSDLLLMSTDNNNWDSFDLLKARRIAEQNGFIYITDFLLESSFVAEDWMINGKNDTIIVSVAYMKEKGKKYAPVTPLVNTVLPFKKIASSFFWRKAEQGKVISVDENLVRECIIGYFNSFVEKIPSVKNVSQASFPIFDSVVDIDYNTMRVIAVDRYFEHINGAVDVFADNAEILSLTGYKFSMVDFLAETTLAAAKRDGISIHKEDFFNKYYLPVSKLPREELDKRIDGLNVKSGVIEVDGVKLAYLSLLKDRLEGGLEYPAGGAASYGELMRTVEQSRPRSEDIIFNLITALSHKPEDELIFDYINTNYPKERENLEKIREFWNVDEIDKDAVLQKIHDLYLPEDCYEEGSLKPGYERALIIKEQLKNALSKYGFKDSELLSNLIGYIDDCDLKSRTYNGTVFDSAEDMKKAMSAEIELRNLCADLSAMSEAELIDLRKYIAAHTIDDKTKGKYLVKIKMALNRSQQSSLNELCWDLPLLDIDGALALLEKIKSKNIDDAIVKPYISKINERILAAQREELSALFSNIEKMSDDELGKMESKLFSGRYADIFKKHYNQKITLVKEERIKAAIDKFCGEYEKLDAVGLIELQKKLKGSDYPPKYTSRIISKTENLLRGYERKRAEEFFKGVDFANQKQLDELKEQLQEGMFSLETLNPYLKKIKQREEGILEEELIDLCADIDKMDKVQLIQLQSDLKRGKDRYNPVLLQKYGEKIAGRHLELKNSELAELCKDIESMEAHKLPAIKAILNDNKYDSELTVFYLKKIAKRERELAKLSLEKLCGDIDKLTEVEKVQELKGEILKNKKYAEVREPFIERLDLRIKKITEIEIEEICGDISEITVKKAFELIRHLNIMRLEDAEIKARFVNLLDSRIMKLREQEAREFIALIRKAINEVSLPANCLCVPGATKDFDKAYDNFCKKYITPGRFEIPLLMHEASPDEGFVLSNEYLHYTEKPGASSKIRIDDIVSFNSKKGLVTSTLSVTEKGGLTIAMPNSFVKSTVEDAVKALNILIAFVKDKRTEAANKEAEKATTAISGSTEEITVEEPPVKKKPSIKKSDYSNPLSDMVKAENKAEEGTKLETKSAVKPELKPEAGIKNKLELKSAKKELAAGKEKAAVKLNFCSECGAKAISEKAKFCHECGSKLA